jgi:hypothetical protein
MIDNNTFEAIVTHANLAPSVHNTQPTRWHLESDGAITLFLDTSRQLLVGDEEGRDARLSCGAALEGTRLALSQKGFSIRKMIPIPNGADGTMKATVRLEIGNSDQVDSAANNVDLRFTSNQVSNLKNVFKSHEDATFIADKAEIASIANMNDTASRSFFVRRDYREELVSWMRFSPSDARWTKDGLSAAALGMSSLEAIAAKYVLRSPTFDILSGLGLAGSIVSEKSKTCSSTGVFLFHRPHGEDPLESGIAYYKLVLELAASGFCTWPMAVLADAPDWRTELCMRFGVHSDRRLINVLRVGIAPAKAKKNRARLSASQLTV